MTGRCPAGTTANGPVCLRTPSVSPAQVRNLARQITHSKALRPPRSPWEVRVIEAVGRAIDRGLGDVFSSKGASDGGLAVVAIILLFLVFVSTRFVRSVQRDPGADVEHRSSVLRTARDWDEEAAAHEQAGRWREALRCRYRALVADLATRGVLDEVPGRTAREYELIVSDRLPEVSDAFREASDLFETAWYGHQPSSEEENGQFSSLASDVLAGAGR